MKDADSLITEALESPTAQRGRIAARLIESLDVEGPPCRSSDRELAAKIDARIAELEAGTARVVDGTQDLDWVRAELRSRRQA